MIASKNIRTVLGTIPTGTKLHITAIQNQVASSLTLGAEDWKPHTKTRPTTYPKWKHRVQGVLADMKKKGQVTHHKESNTYTF